MSARKSAVQTAAAEKSDVKVPTPMSAKSIFTNQRTSEIKEKLKLKHAEAMLKANEEWDELTDDEKQPFEDLHMKEVERYNHQTEEMEEKGYFTMADGTRSDEAELSGKKKRATGRGAEGSAAKSGRKKSAVMSKGKSSAAKKSEEKENTSPSE